MNCKQAQPRISEYIDNVLSARDTWELDRHLSDCSECSRVLAELSRTVEAVRGAARFELSEGFGSRLQARLAGIEPAPARRAWLLGVADMLRPRKAPLWGLSAATCALVAVIVLSGGPGPQVEQQISPEVQQSARIQSVTLSAADPLQDLATANLAAAGDSTSEPEGGR